MITLGKIRIYLLFILLLNSGLIAQENTKTTTILWDTSYSMQDKDLSKELDYLNTYFVENPNLQVSLVPFSGVLGAKTNFRVENGNWLNLKNELNQRTVYDGLSNFKTLNKLSVVGEILIFTDGMGISAKEISNLNNTITILDSSPSGNSSYLSTLVESNNINYLNLSNTKSANLDPFYTVRVYGLERVDENTMALRINEEDRDIKISGRNSFKFQAKAGDSINFFVNQKQITYKVLDNRKVLNLWVEEKIVELEQVVLNGTKETYKDERVYIDDYGKLEKKRVGFGYQTVSQEDFIKGSINLSEALRGKFVGMTYGRDISQFTVRGPKSINGPNIGIIVVDGVPLPRGESTQWLDPNVIEDVTLIRGMSAGVRYGNIGGNGVLVVRTKFAADNYKERKANPYEVKGNYYNDKIESAEYSAVYLNDLKNTNSIDEAYTKYLEIREQYIGTSQFYLDVFDYFIKLNPTIAFNILGNVFEIEEANYEDYRAALFKVQKYGNPSLEFVITEHLAELYPDKMQTYFDLAGAYAKNNRFQDALNLYLAMLDNTAHPTLKFNTMEKTINGEILGLVKTKGESLDVSMVPTVLLESEEEFDARLVVEWNNPNAEFKVQFVNPDKRFFDWQYGYQDKKRLRASVQFGNNTEDFEVVGSGTDGFWLLNAEYINNLNEEDAANSYIKCKVQYNFGRPNQREEIFLLRLHEIGSKNQIARIRV